MEIAIIGNGPAAIKALEAMAACEAACQARAIYIGTTDEITALKGKKAAERAGKERNI